MVDGLCWRINGMDYAMMAVRPAELLAARKKKPNLLGIPIMWTMIDDEVYWFPDSLEGMPEVRKRMVP